MGKEVKAWRDCARQLRDFWAHDSGTSIHLLAADNLDRAADLVEQSTPTLPANGDDLRPLDCEELAIRHGQQVSATFKDPAKAFELFNELRARQALSQATDGNE
jgi:hypothetical protein